MSNKIEFVIDGVDKFSGTFGKLNKSLAVVTKSVTIAASTIAAGAGAVTLFTKQQAKLQDEVNKTAQKLGFAVAELSQYHFLAEQAAISTQTFDMAVQRMARRAAEAAKGTGEAVMALRELNIDAKNFNALSLDGKMEKLSEALNGVKSSSDRVRLAFKLFDSEGVAMLQMLDGGSEKMRRLKADAQFLGAVMSAQGAANATAFTDAMGRLTTAMAGNSRAIADKWIPIMTGFANATANVMARSRDSVAQFAEDSMNGILFMWAAAEQVFTGISNLIPKAFSKEAFNKFMDSFASMITGMFNLAMKVFPAIGAYIAAVFKGIGNSIVELGSWAYNNFINTWKGGEIKSLGDLIFDSIPAATEEARAVMAAAMGDIVADTSDAMGTAGTVIAETLGLSLEGIKSRVDEIKLKFTELGEVVQSTTETNGEALATFGELLTEKWTEQMTQQGTMMETLAAGSLALINSTVDAMSNAVGQSLVMGENLGQSLQNIAKQVLTSLISMLVKVGIQRLVTSVLTVSAATTEGAVQIGNAVGLAGANAYASTAAIPIIGPALAPAVAAASVAGAAASAVSGKAAGAVIGGAAHGGLENVPKESTYLLDKGERVLSPNQNRDLSEFIRGGSGGSGGLVIENLRIDVFPNATNADSFLAMDPSDIRSIVAEKFIDAFDELADMGIKMKTARVTR